MALEGEGMVSSKVGGSMPLGLGDGNADFVRVAVIFRSETAKVVYESPKPNSNLG